MTERKITFKNSQGETLVGLLSDTKSEIVVILCHGHYGNKDSRSVVGLSKKLKKIGLSTLRFDFSGSGYSKGNREELTISKEADEILKASALLKKKFKRIFLFGSSFGGAGALQASIESKDLDVLILKGPAYGFFEKIAEDIGKEGSKEWKTKGYILFKGLYRYEYALLDNARKIALSKNIHKIKIPTLVIHGELDEFIPVSHAKEVVDKISQAKLEIIKNAKHRFTEAQLNKTNNLIIEFVRKQV